MSVETQGPSPESLIPREVPTALRVQLGSRAVRMTRENTSIFMFYPPWSHMRHVYHKGDDSKNEPNSYVWEPDEDLLINLAQHKVTAVKMAEPTDGDVAMYEQYQSRKLMQELAEFGKSDD